MKNLLLIIPNLTMGGAQRSFSILANELSKKYCVYVVYFNKEEGLHYDIQGELISLNVKGGNTWINKIVNFIKRVIRLRKLKKEKNIHTSISFLEGADFINLLTFSQDEKILSIRGSKLNDTTITGFIGWVRKKILIPFLYSKADKIIVVNEGIKRELTDYFNLSPEKIKIIPNYYDLDKIRKLGSQNIPALYKDLLTRPYIISFGRLAPEKGLENLLEIYSEITKHLPEYRLLIIGDGPSYNSLITKCKTLSLHFIEKGEAIKNNTQIIFTGADNNPFKYTSKAKLFIMTSSSEGFPNALAESMICGTPVASTDCPWGPREILYPGSSPTPILQIEFAPYGILIPQLHERDISISRQVAPAIIQILKNNDLLESYSKKGKEKMKEFSIETMLFKWKEIIERKS